MHKILNATHTGELHIGDMIIPCSVLENGTRILSETGIAESFGSVTGAAKRAKTKAILEGQAPMPVFLAPERLKPFIDEDLEAMALNPVQYQKEGKFYTGYPAEMLPKVCNAWLMAREARVLQKQQQGKAQQAEILMRGLAHIGITALVDEATGYQYIRTRNALEEILEKFISKELRKWTKTFPDEFYEHLFRLRGWDYTAMNVSRPSYVGKLTNDLIYERIAPGVLEELKKQTPIDDKGRAKHRYHQRLTEDVGHPRLREHLNAIITLMRISKNWNQFYKWVQTSHPQLNEQMPLLLEEADPEH